MADPGVTFTPQFGGTGTVSPPAPKPAPAPAEHPADAPADKE